MYVHSIHIIHLLFFTKINGFTTINYLLLILINLFCLILIRKIFKMKNIGEASWWHYFERIGQTTKAKCKTCSKIIDQGETKGTNKLKNHLKNYHNKLYNQYEKSKNKIEERKKVQNEKLSFNRMAAEIDQGLNFFFFFFEFKKYS